MKATSIAPANIAFIKYWGKANESARIPRHNSISMNLSDMHSLCTVEFAENLSEDSIEFTNEEKVTEKEYQRIVAVLDRLRDVSQKKLKAKVMTQNNFPKATGIASSASGFAALSLAALTSLGITFNEKELSVFARLASGTACRSIPDGFVEWEAGTSSADSFAHSIFPVDYWEIVDVIVIVTKKMKKISSTEGHSLAPTSPFYSKRMEIVPSKINQVKQAMTEKNFSAFGRIVEDDALNMHAICLTSIPPIIYWEPVTLQIMKSIIRWRENGEVESYFTIDAGPSVHVICRKKDADILVQKLVDINGVKQVVINYPAVGARIINNHLF
ncbi:MAG: diphosphomevalonate decarboxylase [Patescibacteria group bacterium]